MWIKEDIFKLQRIKEVEIDRTGLYRMDRNERTIPFDDKFIKIIREHLSSDILTNYPSEAELYNKIVDRLGCGLSVNNIMMHTGSDLVIKAIFETYIEKHDKVLIHKPSYAMYEVYGNMYGAEVQSLEYNERLEFDLDEYVRIVGEYYPKLAVLENPNGFIGNYYTISEVKAFLDACKKVNAIAVVDEAYTDFCGESVIEEIKDYDNLIIVRTFSKAWGLAGLRLGYAIANEKRINELLKTRPMHQFTGFSAMVCNLLIDNNQYVDEYVEQMNKSRNYTIKELNRLHIQFVYGKTNFITAQIGDKLDIDSFRKRCINEKYLLRRPFREKRFRDWLRIGLLHIDNMSQFICLIEEYMQG